MKNYYEELLKIEEYLAFKAADCLGVNRKSVCITYINTEVAILFDRDKDEGFTERGYEFGCKVGQGEEVKFYWFPDWFYEKPSDGLLNGDTGYVVEIKKWNEMDELPF